MSIITEINKKSVGKRIRMIRKELGLSMNDFGAKIDSKASGGAVGNWERGDNLPNKKRLQKIAQLANVSTSFLLYGKEVNLDNQLVEKINLLTIYNDILKKSKVKFTEIARYSSSNNKKHTELFINKKDIASDFEIPKIILDDLSNKFVDFYTDTLKDPEIGDIISRRQELINEIISILEEMRMHD